MSEIFLTFEEIGNNQIKIERAIHYKLNGKPLFKKVWEAHKQLFREIENWSPGIDTYLEIFNSVLYICWYQTIISVKPNDKHYFTKEIRRLDNLKTELELFTKKPIEVDFPLHQNRILLNLHEYLQTANVEKETIKNIIELIKEEFNISKLNLTSRDKQIREFNSFIKIITNKNDSTTKKLIKLHKKTTKNKK